MNYETQMYKDIPLRLINRHYGDRKAKRFIINETNQNVWIPNLYLMEDGTIKRNVNLDFVFKTRQGKRKLELAGVKKNDKCK